jgi:hypothetical protein
MQLPCPQNHLMLVLLFLYSILPLAATAAVSESSDAPEMTVAEVQSAYSDLFTAKVSHFTESVYTVGRYVVEPPPSHPLAGWCGSTAASRSTS